MKVGASNDYIKALYYLRYLVLVDSSNKITPFIDNRWNMKLKPFKT